MLTPAKATVAIVVAVLATFANSFPGRFVLDDVFEIERNPGIRQLWPIWKTMTAGNKLPARPLPYLSFALDYTLWGEQPFGYHAINVAIHVVAALALFDLTVTTLKVPRFSGRYAERAVPLGLAIALLWAVHPLHTQSITYIYQRMESMAGMFMLLSLAAFARGATQRWSPATMATTVSMAACAMASKEHAVVLPLLILAYDWCFIAPDAQDVLNRRQIYACIALTWLILVAQVIAQGPQYQEFHTPTHSALDYALTQPAVILHYIRLVFVPVGQCFNYEWPIAHGSAAVLPVLIVLLLVGLTTAGIVRQSPVAWIGAAFFLLLAPTSSVLPVEAVAAEHRMYLPLAAIVAATVLAIEIGRQYLHWPAGPMIMLVGAAVIGLGTLTVTRNTLYHTAWGVWVDVLRQDPENWRANWALAGLADGRGDAKAAIAFSRQATRGKLNRSVYILNEMALARAKSGNFAAAERYLRAALDTEAARTTPLDPVVLQATAYLALAVYSQDRDAEAAALCRQIEQPLQDLLGPDHPTTQSVRRLMATLAPDGPLD